MEFRSKSYRDQTYQIESYSGGSKEAPRSMKDLRCHSANYDGGSQSSASSAYNPPPQKKMEKKKGSLGKSSKNWSLNDPELQRKKRVAGYKVYCVEGKMKGSLRKSVKWIKNTYTQAVNGWW